MLFTGLAVGSLALVAAFGVEGAARVIFGTMAIGGSAKTATLPILFFQREPDRNTISTILESLVLATIGHVGLRVLTDENLLNYAVPSAFLTWCWMARVIQRQGMEETVGEGRRGPGTWTKFGAVYARGK
jgi:hypothetical protein